MNIMEGAGGEVVATVRSDDVNYLVCRADEDIKEIKRMLQEERSYKTENERLRNHLHRISLASQNSMSSQAECGRIAREALEGK